MNSWVHFIRFLGASLCLLALNACSELNVFHVGRMPPSMDKISSIEVNPDGQLELNWVLKDKAPKSVYDIYLMEVDANDETYQFTDQAVFNSPLKSEELEVDPKISPSKKGTLLDSVKDLHFVLADTIDTKRLYALQIVEKIRRQPPLAKVILLQANFEPISEAKGTVAGDKILLEWKDVPGANHYEVYADETMGVLLGKSDANHLELESFGKAPLKDYYVRALRGVLAAKDVIKISLNQSNATILKVSALSPDGLYSLGQQLDFAVEFSEPVTVYGSSFLPLRIQNQIRKASYVSGTSTKSITFRYVVAAGDDTADLDTEASLLGSYLDGIGLEVSPTLPAPGQGLTLKELSNIAIDTIKPTPPASVGFSNILSSNGNFDLHWAASEDLHFLRHNIKLCSDMACETSCGSEASSADTMLSFSGISQGVYYGCVQGEDLTGLKSAWTASLTPISVDTSPPSVVRVYSQSADGNFKETQTVNIAVEFDEAVLVSGSDAFLTLAAGSTDRNAIYSSGSGSATLIFTYTVQAGDESSDLNYKDIHSLSAGTGTLRDLAAHDALLTLAPLNSSESLAGQSAIVIDTTAPLPPSGASFSGATSLSNSFPMSWTSGSDTHLKQHNVKLCALSDCLSSCSNVETATTSPHTMSVASDGTYYGCVQSEDQVGHLSLWVPSALAIQVDSIAPIILRVTAAAGTLDAVYKEGDVIDLAILFSENVTVTNGSEIKLALETGTTDRKADYLAGSGGNILVFRYTVQPGDFSADLSYLDASALTVGAGSIRDSSTHDAILTLPSLASVDSLANQQALVIDTAAPSDPSGIVFQNPISNTTNLAISWAASADPHFSHYNVKVCSASDCSTNCSSVVTTTLLSSTQTGVDGSSYYACVQAEDLYAHASAWIASADMATVDTSAAFISSVSSSSSDDYYKTGDIILIPMTFSEAVTVTQGQDLSLLLETGASDRTATYASGSGTDTLIFSYTVQAGDNSPDLEFESTSALSLGANGAIKDAGGTPAVLTLPALQSANSIAGQKAIVIDTTNPADPGSPGFASTLSNSTSFDLSWAASTDANFSTHKLKICTDSACSAGCISDTTSATSPATMSGVNGTTYYGCVQGEDRAGLTSAWVSSLGTLTVDTTVPTVVSISSTEADGAFKAGSIIPISVVFSEAVNVANGSDLGLQLETGTPDRTIPYTSGSGSNTLLFTYTVQAGDTSADLEVLSQSALTLGASGTIQDLAGSNSDLTLPALAGPNSLSGQKSLVIDTSAPAAPSISVPGPNAYLTSDLTTLSGTCEAGATIEIKSNGSVVGTTTAVGPSWSLTLATPLADGIYSLTAIASDAAGNSSTASTANIVTVATSAPDAPVIAALTSPSNDAEPSISGSSQAGMTIQVYADAVLVATTTADASGNWSVDTSTLSDQAYIMTATATDAASRTSSASSGVPLTIDTTPPSAPSAVVFDAPLSSTVSLSLSWTNSTDVNFLHHNVKLCTANTCASGCTAEINSVSTPATLNGVDGTSYYACVQGEDLLGQKSNWIASAATATIDTSFPTVSNVSSSAADGYYKVGETLDISVQFSEPVTVSNEADLGLLLKTGAIDRTASYTSGSGTNTLIFRYTVQANDTSADLDYASTSALSKGASGTIRDSVGNDASLTLPPLAGAQSLAGQKSIVIDTTAPSSPSNVTFASNSSNSATFDMSWTASSDTNFSTHNVKICTAADCSTGCTSASTAATSPQAMTGIDGATYYGCAQGLDLAGQTSSWIPSAGTITIDTTVPSISNVNATNTDGYYKVGDTIDITVLSSEVVYVQNGGDIGLLLETGTPDRTAVFTGGSGTNTLTFTYTVQAGDTSADLDYQSLSALTLGATGSIKDSAGNTISLTLPALGGSHSIAGQKALIIDTTPPTSPVAVSFGSSTSMSTSLNLTWTNSSDTNFSTHNVKLCDANDCSTSCSAVTTSLSSPLTLSGVNGSSYYACVQGLDAAGQTSSWVPSGGLITVDTSLPTISSVSSTTDDGYYKTGDVIAISILFSESVTVTTPAQLGLLLETGGTDRTAVYSGGSGTNTLTFDYTVQSGDISSDLNYPSTAALTVGTGSIKDSAGNNAILTLPDLASANSLATQKSLVIDTIAPTDPSSVAFSGSYATSTTFPMSWTASTDTNFATHNVKICTSSDCSTSCTSEITSLTSPASVSGVDGATYYGCVQGQDSAGLKSTWKASASSITVDASLPSVLSVNSTTADGAYKLGASIDVTVLFSEAVTVTNGSELGLLLETGTTDRTASYSSGSGTATLTFTYTVAAGDTSSDLNYASPSALTRGSSGTIRDAAGNNASLTLPDLASASSLAGQRALVIDTTPPADPSSVGFASAYVNTTTFNMSWSNSTDTNFSTHNTKICTSNTCASGCTSVSTSLASPKSVTGVNGVTYYGCVQGVDTAGNSTGFIASLASVTVDTTAPTSPTISIASGDAYTTSLSNTLSLSASGADEMYVTNTAGCTADGNWESYSSLKTWNLGQTNNTATVYVRFRDFAGNMTSCVNDTIIHDSTAPTSTGISINGGAATTSTTAVTLTMSATDANAIQRYVTNTAGCGSGGVWESFSTSKSWTLGQTGGTATVYVQYRDAAGNTSACINDTITHLNPPIPSGTSVSINSGAASTNSTSVSLTLAATNVTDVYITNAPGCNSGGSWVSYATSKSWVLSLDSSSTAAVYVKYRNTAVSESSCISDTITFAPTNLASNGDFELGNLTGWSVDTVGKWLVDNSSPLQGSYSAHTASLSDGNIECIYRNINLSSSSVDAQVTFTWAYLTEPWYDYGNFEIDGNEILWDSGEEAGRTFKRIVPKGANRELAWCFYKDGDYSAPGEFVKVDDIKVIPLSLRPPTAVTATGLNQKVTLNIEAPVGSQTGYLVVRGSSAMPVFAPVNGTSYSTGAQDSDQIVYKGTSLTPSDAGLTNGQNYYYAVYSYDASNNYSLPTTVTGKPSAVHTPVSLTASTASTHSNLSWTVTAGGTETGYLLVRNTGSPVTFTPTPGVTYSTGSVTGGQVVYTGSSLSYDNTGLTNGTRYYYSVWAYDSSRNYSALAASTMAYPTNVFAIFYQDSNYNGWAISLPPGSYTTAQLNAVGISDESVSSLKVPSGWTVTMYKNEDFTGVSWFFNADATGVPAGANDQMSSVIITAP